MKGLIYRAYNKISKKSYIGQTINPLRVRMFSHYRTAKMIENKYHFVRALMFYNKEDWEWTVVEDNIEQEMLNEKEIYYIKFFDTFENGYNSTYGGNTVKVAKIHSFYHKDYGHVESTIRDLAEKYNIHISTLTSVTNEKYFSTKGWVLSKNADKCMGTKPKKEKIVKPKKEKIIKPKKVHKRDVIHTIIYKNGVKITGTLTYIAEVLNLTFERVRQMTTNKPLKRLVKKEKKVYIKKEKKIVVKQHNKWIYTMTNGSITESLTSKEWSEKYNIPQTRMTCLIENKIKKTLWRFIEKHKNI